MRVGVVGLGSIGRRHAGNLLKLGAVVVGMDPSKVARDRAVAEYPTLQALDFMPFARLDALVIATPMARHLIWVRDAVLRGLPFLVEKPVGTFAQLPAWHVVLKRRLPVHMVGYNWRFNREVAAWRAQWQRKSGVRLFLTCATNMADWPGQSYGDPVLECSHEHDLRLWWNEPQTAVTITHGVEPSGRTYLARWGKHSAVCEPSQASIDESYLLEMQAFLRGVETGRLVEGCSLADGVRVMESLRAERAA